MNLIKRTLDIQERTNIVKIYVQIKSIMESCPLMISHILAEFHPERGDIHNFAQSLLLNGLSKSAQTVTVGFVKLLSTHPIYIFVWGNFPFKRPQKPVKLQMTFNSS